MSPGNRRVILACRSTSCAPRSDGKSTLPGCLSWVLEPNMNAMMAASIPTSTSCQTTPEGLGKTRYGWKVSTCKIVCSIRHRPDRREHQQFRREIAQRDPLSSQTRVQEKISAVGFPGYLVAAHSGSPARSLNRLNFLHNFSRQIAGINIRIYEDPRQSPVFFKN